LRIQNAMTKHLFEVRVTQAFLFLKKKWLNVLHFACSLNEYLWNYLNINKKAK